MVRPQANKGFTLLEAALVFSLLLVLMALMAAYLIQGKRYALESESYASVQRNNARLLRTVTNDLYRATKNYLHLEPDGQALWFLSSAPNDDSEPYLEFQEQTGKIIWKKWVCYYYDPTTSSIIRAEQPLDTPESELLIPPSPSVDLTFFQTSASVNKQPLSRSVSAFTASSSGQGVLISITCREEAPITNSHQEYRQVEVSAATLITLQN